MASKDYILPISTFLEIGKPKTLKNRPGSIEALSPYLTANINRFGMYDLDEDRQVIELDFDLNPDVIWENEPPVEEGQETMLALNY